jgi:hypothetical protein
MKKIYHSLLLLFMAAGMAGLYSSCTKDGASGSTGTPRVSYVRITDPASADSLLVGAGQGSLVAIVGENLGNTVEIWFNDQKAVLTPTYITDKNILVTVPTQIPTEITNKLKMVFTDGSTLEHDFKLEVSEPLIGGMVNEYALDGEVATIKGNFFYEPLTVTFAGNKVAQVVSVKADVLQVTVPAGAQAGQVTVKTNFGETKSDFMFRDNRNIFISSDPFTGWWNASYVVSAPGADDPAKINGNYIRVKKLVGAWAWTEIAGGAADAMGPISKNIPDEAITKPENYSLKFEVNTRKPYNSNQIKINVGLLKENNDAYKWNPPIDTKGQWRTITIPFDDVTKSYGAPLTVNPAGYWTRLMMHGPGDLDADISFDNFRVVPEIIKK